MQVPAAAKMIPVAVGFLLAACAENGAQPTLSGDARTEMHNVRLTGCNAVDFDTPPIIKSGKRPVYPIDQLLERNSGVAMAIFKVTDNGHVVDEAATSNEDKSFATHLLIAIRAWEIEPAKRQGVPVTTTCKITMNFAKWD